MTRKVINFVVDFSVMAMVLAASVLTLLALG